MAKQTKQPTLYGEPIGCIFCLREVDHAALGHKMRQEREGMGMTQTEVAREMKVTRPYVCDLEHGKRNWTASMAKRYLAAVRGIV